MNHFVTKCQTIVKLTATLYDMMHHRYITDTPPIQCLANTSPPRARAALLVCKAALLALCSNDKCAAVRASEAGAQQSKHNVKLLHSRLTLLFKHNTILVPQLLFSPHSRGPQKSFTVQFRSSSSNCSPAPPACHTLVLRDGAASCIFTPVCEQLLQTKNNIPQVLPHAYHAVSNVPESPGPGLGPIESVDLFSCAVCTCDYDCELQIRTPHILPGCGHTFCLECIERLVMHAASEDEEEFACPTCNHQCRVPHELGAQSDDSCFSGRIAIPKP
jgi:hypothetical protein